MSPDPPSCCLPPEGAEGKRAGRLHRLARYVNSFRPVQGWWKEKDRMTAVDVATAGDRDPPIIYGAPKPPTTEELAEQRRRELERAEDDLWHANGELSAIRDELDRLRVPTVTPHGDRLDTAMRVRYLACGSLAPSAQPRLLAEWAPDIWSGRRRFGPTARGGTR